MTGDKNRGDVVFEFDLEILDRLYDRSTRSLEQGIVCEPLLEAIARPLVDRVRA